jgi:hypothetical protein
MRVAVRFDRRLRLVLSMAILAFSGNAMALDAAASGASAEYRQAKSELDGMVADRNLGVFEVEVTPLALKRMVVTDPAKKTTVLHYLTFRVRNRTGSDRPLSQTQGYNAVLETVTKQYENTSIQKVGGVRLTSGKETIVERADGVTANRHLSLTFIARDEHGFRANALDAMSGAKVSESFDFPDGIPAIGLGDGWMRDRIEESEGRRLLTTEELRKHDLPPYDATAPTQTDGQFGWSQGEVYGVAIFPTLGDYGNRVTIEVRGASNKFRERWTDSAKPDASTARFLRRVYLAEFLRSGDEFRRDMDVFSLVRSGWDWSPSFQRLERRQQRVNSDEILATIGNPDLLEGNDRAKEAKFWDAYETERAKRKSKSNLRQLPDLKRDLSIYEPAAP